MKLGICVPMCASIPASWVANFVNRLAELHSNGRNYEVRIFIEQGTVIDYARNKLTEQALKAGCDYIMFIDADVLIPKNTIDDLVDMNLDIVSGLYFTKGKPHLPVARIKDKEDDIAHRHLEDFEFGKIMKVAGTGFGCILIKAEVFKNIEYPYFKFEWRERNGRQEQLAEDLYFCDKAKDAGYDTYLNTGIVCEHFGAPVGAAHFMIFKEQLLLDKEIREDVFECLMKLDDIDKEEVEKRLRTSMELRKAEWEKVDKDNSKEVLDYYVNNNYELYDHLGWHLNSRRTFDKKILETIKRLYPDKTTEILDYGCGGGQMAFMLAEEGYNVTTVEPNKKSNEFMNLRFSSNRVKRKILNYPISKQLKNKYDVILCFDVLEHIPDDKFEDAVNEIKGLKKAGGIVLSTISFGAQDIHPMHYDLTHEKKELLMDLVKTVE